MADCSPASWKEHVSEPGRQEMSQTPTACAARKLARGIAKHSRRRGAVQNAGPNCADWTLTAKQFVQAWKACATSAGADAV